MSRESAKPIEHTAVEERASQWLARRDSGQWSPQDETDFEAWIGASMAHRVAYWRLKDAWENALRLKALGAGVLSEDPPPPGQWNLSPFFTQSAQSIAPDARKARLGLRALAAGVLVAVAAATIWYARYTRDHFETSVGAVTSLPTQDGSKITLNTDSRIKVAFNDTERRIDLDKGEAFFEVAKDPTRPFVVQAGDKRITAIGTQFSVRKGLDGADKDIQVIVTDGAVRIDSANQANQRSPEALTAGTVVRTAGDTILIQRKKPREAEEALSWRTGVIVFDNTTLGHAAAEFNRYNTRKIRIDDPATAAIPIAGSFRTTNLDSFIEVLEKGYPVKVVRESSDFVVDPAP